MNYQDFGVEDFVADPFFQQWILAPDEMTDTFWENWQKAHPHKQSEVEQAIQLIREMRFKTVNPHEQDFRQVWQEIVTHRTTGHYKVKAGPQSTYRWYVAASLLLLGLSLGIWWIGPSYYPSMLVYQTEYGQKQQITLPDGSSVILGANSQLRHHRAWAADEPRTVTLQGEAFFSVTHQANNQPFVVQSAEVAIEVLGTRFNVNNRRGGNQIRLEEGSIRLDMSQVKVHQPNQPRTILMQPGEVVEISSDHVAKKNINTAPYISWTRDTLIFRQAPLRDIIRTIEDHYGYTVTTPGVAVDELLLTAELHTTELDMILRYLAEVFDLTVYKKEHEITLTLD